MRMRSLALSLPALVLVLCTSPRSHAAGAPPGTKAYVSNSDSDDVSVVDLSTMAEITRIDVGNEPRGPAATPDGSLVFVPNRFGELLGGMSSVPTVSVISTVTDTVVDSIVLTRLEPYNCAVTPDATRLYVVCKADDAVSVVDIATREEVATIALPVGASPEGVAITPNGAKVYVVNRQLDSVSVIDTATNTVVAGPIPVGSSPRDAKVSDDGTKVIVVGEGPPVIILTATDTLSATFLDDIGTQRDVAVHGDRAYVTNFSFNPPVEAKGAVKAVPAPGQASLDVYDLATEAYLTSIEVLGNTAYGVDLLGSGACAYVAAQDSNSLQEIDLVTQEDTDNFASVGSGPRGIVVVEAVEIVDSFFLPKTVSNKPNAKKPAKSLLRAGGIFDTGSQEVDLTAAATLSVGTADFQIPSLTASKNGRTFKFAEGGLSLVIVKNPFGSSRAKFRLQFKGDLGAAVPTDGNVQLRFRNAVVDGVCEVQLQQGGFRLGRKRGALSQPNVFVVRSHAFVKGAGKDSLAIIVGLATGGVTPDAAPEVRVQYGSILSATIPAGAFTRKGDTYSFKGDVNGITAVKLDYLREQITIVGKKLDLGALPPGQSALTIIVGVGDEDRGVAVRVSRKGGLLKY